MTAVQQIRGVAAGKPLDPLDPRTRHAIAVTPLLAWVGLGADRLSSSCYGPEEAFLALGQHTAPPLILALATGFHKNKECDVSGSRRYPIYSVACPLDGAVPRDRPVMLATENESRRSPTARPIRSASTMDSLLMGDRRNPHAYLCRWRYATGSAHSRTMS